MFFFFFSSRRRHTRFDCDWSSDVCSSDHGAAVPARQTLQLLLERGGPLQKMPVFPDQKAHALGRGNLETQALAPAHAVEESRRHLQLADLLAFRLDEDQTRRIEMLQRAPHQ